MKTSLLKVAVLLAGCGVLSMGLINTANAACPEVVLPVCAVKKGDTAPTTYGNACKAKAAKARILHSGDCLGPWCVAMYNPVCAISPNSFPQTYASLCYAEVNLATFLRKGTCK